MPDERDGMLSAQESVITALTGTVASIAQVYWRWYRGIGRSSEVIEFTNDLAKALGEYKGDGA
jgi:hypothetical protein